MTRRERVTAALTGRRPDRIPRAYTAIPGFVDQHPEAYARIQARFPPDVDDCGFVIPDGATRGDPYAVGTYVDEWGCVFENVHAGVVGQVKRPIIASFADLDRHTPPMHLVGRGMDEVNRTCDAVDGFTMSALPLQPFERMQFLRGTENLLMDLAEQSAGFFKLRDMVHEFNCAQLDAWCKTNVDATFIADDWGTQNSLLISPTMWRDLFKPLYTEYAARSKAAGKFVYMHSDGYIIDLLDDLIDVGIDAINAQVTCMDMGELGRRFAGRITFWGQMDRQHMLPFGTPDDARRAARDFHHYLRGPNSDHIVAQMHIEPGARPENIEAVLETFQSLGEEGAGC